MRAAAKAAPGISIHPPRAGRDVINSRNYIRQTNFNPPAPCGAGQYMMCDGRLIIDISIHPPRAGRDPIRRDHYDRKNDFNPPAPCGAGRPCRSKSRPAACYFNPPAPCGAGQGDQPNLRGLHDFNPPAPCGAGRWLVHHFAGEKSFQSTRPVRGGTLPPSCCRQSQRKFQSTRPVRGGTAVSTACPVACFYFNPPAPCGAGPSRKPSSSRYLISIHPPRAGRDSNIRPSGIKIKISIHPPRAGRDHITVDRP